MEIAGLTRTQDQARAANEYTGALLDTGSQVGGRARAVEGQRVLADILVPEQYRAPIRQVRDIVRTELPPEAATPLVPAFRAKRATQAEAPSITRPEAVDEVVRLLDQTAEALDGAVYVPRQMREALALQVGRVLGAARTTGDGTGLLSVRYWQQMVVLGAFTSRATQGLMDWYGDHANLIAAGYPWKAVRAGIRSALPQMLMTPGAGQVLRLTDMVLAAVTGKDVKAGTVARAWVAWSGFSPEVTAIMRGDPNVRIGGETAERIRQVAQEYNVFETLYTGQLPEVLTSKAREVYGVTAKRAIATVLEGNQRILRDMANQTATRRRVAILHSFLEDGVPLQEAARRTVQIVGDFAGELHPLERGVISLLYPFWSYRKYAIRRVLRNLASPYWMTRFVRAEEYGSDILSAFMDDSDEFGLHTDSMAVEYDPEEIYKLYMALAEKRPNLDLNSDEAKTLVAQMAEEAGVPRAIVRYERLADRLRADSITKGRAQVLKDMKSDPDFVALQVYYAPDPVKDMLPLWAQDRAVVFDNEHRSQATAGWYNTLVVKASQVVEPRKDTVRFSVLPSNPFHSALADAITFAAVGGLVTELGNQLMGQASPLSGGGKLLQGLADQPAVRTAARLFTDVELGESSEIPTTLGPVSGPLLQRIGLAESVIERVPQPTVRVGAPTEDGEQLLLGAITGSPRYKYELSKAAQDGMVLVPPIAEVVFGILEVENVLAGFGGESFKPMVDSVSNTTYNILNTSFGFKTYRGSPSAWERAAVRRADAKLKRVVEDLPAAETMPTTPETERQRAATLFEAGEPETKYRALRDAASRVVRNEREMPQDWEAYRALLVRLGKTQEEVASMNDERLLTEVRAVLLDPTRTVDVAGALR